MFYHLASIISPTIPYPFRSISETGISYPCPYCFLHLNPFPSPPPNDSCLNSTDPSNVVFSTKLSLPLIP